MNCPKCQKPMTNKGNLSGFVFTSNPLQRDETRVCDDCKCKVLERVRGTPIDTQGYSDYELISPTTTVTFNS